MTARRAAGVAAPAVAPFVALMWIVAAGTAAAADGYDHAAWWQLLLNQLVLVPALAGAAWWIGRNLAGGIGAIVAPFAVALVPVLGVIYSERAFRATYVDRVLAEAVGIADGARFAAGALLLVAVALVVASRAGGRTNRTLAAAGVAVAVAVLAVTAIRTGLGLDISRDAFDANMAGLREFTWSNRLLQWLPLAGAIGAARRSPLTAVLLGGWFGTFAVAYGASPNVGVGDGSFFAALVPALPAFSLLLACVPLLVPTVPAWLGERMAA